MGVQQLGVGDNPELSPRHTGADVQIACYLDTPAQALAVSFRPPTHLHLPCTLQSRGRGAGPDRFKALRAGLQEDRYRLVAQLKEAHTDPDGTVCPGCEALIQCSPFIRCSPARACGLWVCSVTRALVLCQGRGGSKQRQ
jgi:hypothetical protein